MTFLRLLAGPPQKGVKMARKRPSRRWKTKNAISGDHPPSKPPKTAFLAIFVRYGRDHNFGRFSKNALFHPFLGGPKTPQKPSFSDFSSPQKN
jgi:hypothetical protein